MNVSEYVPVRCVGMFRYRSDTETTFAVSSCSLWQPPGHSSATSLQQQQQRLYVVHMEDDSRGPGGFHTPTLCRTFPTTWCQENVLNVGGGREGHRLKHKV